MCAIEVPEGKDTEGGADKIFKEIVINTFPNLMKTINPQIQEVQ